MAGGFRADREILNDPIGPGDFDMWYFAWLLGVGLACSFGILNAMWFEVHADDERDRAAVANDY